MKSVLSRVVSTIVGLLDYPPAGHADTGRKANLPLRLLDVAKPDFSVVWTRIISHAGQPFSTKTGGRILQASPQTKGVVFDLPQVAAGANAILDELGVADRCECVGGDFFVSVPPGADAYLLTSIIHDWDDERSRAILENCREAMPPSGKVLLVEMVIPPGDTPFFGKILDLEMMVTPGGRERTADEFRALLSSAGLELTRIVPTESPSSIIEAVPA